MKSKGVIVAGIIIAIAVSVYIVTNFSTNKPELDSNPYVKEYSLPDGSGPNALLVDDNGMVWISTSKPNLLLSFDPKSQKTNTYEIKDTALQKTPLGNSTMVWSMVQDSDGVIWISQSGTDSIWSFEPQSGVFHWHESNNAPFQMKSNNSEVWTTTINENTIGVIKNENGYHELLFPTGNKTGPAGLFVDGNFLWSAEVLGQKIVKYDIKRDSQGVQSISKTELYPKGNGTLLSPTDVLFTNNTLWITEHETSFLTRYDISDNKITRYPTSQSPYHTVTLPFWLRPSSQGDGIWFNEHQGSKIGYFDLQKKTLTEYSIMSLPKDGYVTYSLNLATDPHDDQTVWFSEWNTDKIGTINGHEKIPFDTSTENNTLVLGPNETKSISLFINGTNPSSNNMLAIKTSSSIVTDASLGNLTIQYPEEKIDLTKTNAVKLYVHNNGVKPGLYMLGLGASDGFVTKTVYVQVTIRP